MAHPAIDLTDATTLYTQAIHRIKSIQQNEPPQLDSSGRTQFITHGYRVERAAILFHGYTNAPQQFRALGQRLFSLGYNVLIPRAPHHGLPEPHSAEHAQLTAEELKISAQQALDVAGGLGERVSVIGLSMGGLMTGWLAHFRSDVDVAMLIAPAFGLQAIPHWLTPLMREAALTLPNVFRWWDPELKANGGGPRHAYSRYSTHGLAQVLRLSRDLQAAAKRSKPAARSIVVVTNANDESVDNVCTAKFVTDWRTQHAEQVSTYEFSVAQQLVHDLIDPEQPRQRVDYVYQVLIELLQRAE